MAAANELSMDTAIVTIKAQLDGIFLELIFGGIFVGQHVFILPQTRRSSV